MLMYYAYAICRNLIISKLFSIDDNLSIIFTANYLCLRRDVAPQQLHSRFRGMCLRGQRSIRE